MKRAFKVTLKMPPGADLKYVTDYIRDAVKSHAGGMDPQDVMFDLNSDSVSVRPIREFKLAHKDT